MSNFDYEIMVCGDHHDEAEANDSCPYCVIKRLTAEVGILKRLVYLWVDPCVVDPEDEKLVMNCVEFVNSAVSEKGG